jgi:U3 small nucleolar ribonucleoprotein protein LCP5
MATTTSLTALLNTLTDALTSATESVSKIKPPIPPKDGISLLDVKNELFLSYLQNLVFLIILKLRNRRHGSSEEDESLDTAVVKKLVELQVYLDKGVRPLEARLKYQIDKVLRAADDAKRAEDAAKPKAKTNADEEEEEATDDGSDVESTNGDMNASEIDDLQYRPNPSAFVRPATTTTNDTKSTDEGLYYKPPRIQATVMPTTGPREKEARKPNKSATLDEFVSTELSTAPMAEPSIGTTIISGGRRSKTEKEKTEEREKKEYEERNYVRLPKESKKDRAKKGGRKDAGYGGEEWRGLGEGIDRIERLTKRSGERVGMLDKSRKRPTEDGPRQSGGGAELGQGYQKRQKTTEKSGRRDRGRK